MSAYYEVVNAQPFDPAEIFTSCIESGAPALLLDEAALPADFFDLSSGVAGELLHKLSTYRMRMAGVVPDPTVHSPRFQEFLQESNRGQQFRFFATRHEAIDWLQSSARE